MNKNGILLAFLFALAVIFVAPSRCQVAYSGPGAPVGHCYVGTTGLDTNNGNLYTCSKTQVWPTTPVGGNQLGLTTSVYISAIGCAQGADLATGYLAGTTTPATDAGPCINAYLAAHVTPGSLLLLHQDGASVVSGIFGPAGGGWGIVADIPPGTTKTTITGCTIASNVLTCSTANNSLVAGAGLVLNGFPTSTFLNNSGGNPAVIPSTVTATSFSAPYVHANATIEAGVGITPHGYGFYQQSGSNNDLIHNGTATALCVNGYSDIGWTTPGPAPARGSGLVFRNLFLNGNRGDGTRGNSTTGLAVGTALFQNVYGSAYCSYMGVNLINVNNIVVNNNYFFDIATYHLRLTNAGNAEVNGNTFDAFGPGVVPIESNQDGIHVSGPAEDIHADGNLFRTGDDAFGLNAAEGWVGPIRNVTINNSRMDMAATGGRMYAASIAPPVGDAMPTVSNVLIDGMVGTVQYFVGALGYEGQHTLTVPGTLSNIRYNNVALTVLGGTNYTNFAQDAFWLSDNAVDLSFSHIAVSGIADSNHPMFLALNSPTVASLNLEDITINRTALGSSTGGLLNLSGATVGRLTIDGARVVDTDGGSYGTVPNLVNVSSGTTIAGMAARGIDFTNVGQTVSDPTRVTSFLPSRIVVGPAVSQFSTAAAFYNVNQGQVMQFNPAGGTDQKAWDWLDTGLYLQGRAVNDANTAASNWIQVMRNGYQATQVILGEQLLTTNYSTAPTGSCTVVGFALTPDGHGSFCNGSSWSSKF